MKPKKIMSKFIMEGTITVSIYKTDPSYDIILEGEKDCLEKAKKAYNSESKILKKGVFGRPVLVFDTFSKLEDAKNVYYQLEDMKE